MPETRNLFSLVAVLGKVSKRVRNQVRRLRVSDQTKPQGADSVTAPKVSGLSKVYVERADIVDFRHAPRR